MLVECTVHIEGMGLIMMGLLLLCPIIALEGRGFFSCISVFFNFELSNFSVSAISDLSAMVVEEAERGARRRGV